MVPAVSILLPAYDAEATLPACLASVLRQSEPRWECVVVDDGSRDHTEDVARAFAERDPRVVVVAAAHRGLVGALEAGLARCRAPVVARMDADDLMRRDRLAAQLLALAREPRLSAVGSHVRVFPRAGLRDGLSAYERWLATIDSPERVHAEAFVECPIAHPTLAIRRDVLTRFGYRDDGWPEDYDLLLRLLAAGHRVGVVPRRLLAWRDGPDRLWRTGAAYGRERITACKAAHLAAGFLAGSDSYTLCGYGSTGRALRRALLRHGKRMSHLVDVDAGRLGNVIDGAPVVGIDALGRLPRRPVVVSVAGARPRALVRQTMAALGLRETRDFVCAA